MQMICREGKKIAILRNAPHESARKQAPYGFEACHLQMSTRAWAPKRTVLDSEKNDPIPDNIAIVTKYILVTENPKIVQHSS